MSIDDPEDGALRLRLTRIGWGMHDEFLALPGYATHLSRPHPRTPSTAFGMSSSRHP
ncbi:MULTISPECIES: hypothetical protein [Mycobacteriaceae]|uniref:hypothetical protein n=1 Tax=Mycobacteriaceae TaxID=1762 RepID=UPI001A98FCA3|nr:MULTISPECIES: hypothetical protein [Mycobacteriaceae]QZH61225.1 hypothetical protein K1X22_05510 [Mycolicibacterium farcinogenes]